MSTSTNTTPRLVSLANTGRTVEACRGPQGGLPSPGLSEFQCWGDWDSLRVSGPEPALPQASLTR